MLTNAQKTLKLFEVATMKTKNNILDNIAKHYNITEEEAFNEVTHPTAESILDYLTGQERYATLGIMRDYNIVDY